MTDIPLEKSRIAQPSRRKRKAGAVNAVGRKTARASALKCILTVLYYFGRNECEVQNSFRD
jgi:hypothetical protein